MRAARSSFISARTATCVRRVSVLGLSLQPSCSFATKSTKEAVMQKLEEDRKRLAEIMAEAPDQKAAWQSLWTEKVTPWDLGKSAPPLLSILKTELFSESSGRVLVPGCGGGHDVAAFAEAGKQVIGLDISEEAANVARKTLEARGVTDKASIVLQDFFKYEPEQKFDIIYDYTFLCALPPELRIKWAEKIHQLLAYDGHLIFLIFPVDGHEGGPPYALSPEIVQELLQPHKMKEILLKPVDNSVPSRSGREWLGVWRKERPSY